MYECTVYGSSAAFWKGTAVNCPESNNEINFNTFLNTASCNEGAINASVIRADNNSYTSQLTVSVTSVRNGGNISCFSEGADGLNVLIGSVDLTITTGKFARSKRAFKIQMQILFYLNLVTQIHRHPLMMYI